MKHWFYISKGMIEDETKGPLTDEQMIALISAGAIKPKTKVSSAKDSRGFIDCESVTMFSDCFQAIKTSKELEKAEQKEAAKQEKEHAKEQRRLQREAEAINRLNQEAEQQRQQAEWNAQNAPQFQCPFCKSSMGARLDSKTSNVGLLLVILLLLFCFPIFWMGFFLRDQWYTCKACGMTLG